jgi:hypothetical protein
MWTGRGVRSLPDRDTGQRLTRARGGDNGAMTMPDEDSAGSDREARPLGAEVAPPGDPDSHDGEPGPADGIAGPSYPPEETEPDAR